MTILDTILRTENEARKEDYGVLLSQSERAGIRNYVNTLLSKAKPGNYASRKLDQRFGIDCDRTANDFGDEPQRYE